MKYIQCDKCNLKLPTIKRKKRFFGLYVEKIEQPYFEINVLDVHLCIKCYAKLLKFIYGDKK